MFNQTPFMLEIPTGLRAQCRISLDLGETLFVLGANGTGKSSLMGHFCATHRNRAIRITAHRQTWLASSAVDVSGSQRRQMETQLRERAAQPETRWRDDLAAHRSRVAIYDLLDAENVRARKISKAVSDGDLAAAQEMALHAGPLAQLNDMLRMANMPIELFLSENDQVMARKDVGEPYSAAELSDGERNALLLGAEVLCAIPGSLILVDEPERHLHRSIAGPLLSALFARRSDCAFVVATHDISLPQDNPRAKVVLVRGCRYSGQHARQWDVDVLAAADKIDDELRRDVLGSRRMVLFVEGDRGSLDYGLFSALCPGVSVISRGSCRDVERAVIGARGCEDLHWLKVIGVVDNDERGAEDLDRLRANGVYAMDVHAVEAVYYDERIRKMAAAKFARLTGADCVQAAADAARCIITEVAPHAERIAQRVAEKRVREAYLARMPTSKIVKSGGSFDVKLDVGGIVDFEVQRLRDLLSANNDTEIIRRYPIRETPALDRCAKALGFAGRTQYEEVVRVMFREDAEAARLAWEHFGGLRQEMGIE